MFVVDVAGVMAGLTGMFGLVVMLCMLMIGGFQMLVFSKDKYLKETGERPDIPWIYVLDGRELNELKNEGYEIMAEWCEEVSL